MRYRVRVIFYAFNGCLGATYRRRTWRAAISVGELPSSFDPMISEWGNPLMHGMRMSNTTNVKYYQFPINWTFEI